LQTTSVLVTLIVYNLVLIGIGLWASRRARSEADFLLGGRGLGPVVSGLAYAASTSSAWVLLGFSGFVYSFGLAALWMVPGILGGYILVWFWLGPGLQKGASEEGHLTAIDVLASGSTGRARKTIQIVAAAMIAFCFSFYIAGQFQAAGLAFDEVFQTGQLNGVLIGAGIILFYVFLGGFWAVSLTDTLQGFLMVIVAVLVPVMAFLAVGGWDGMMAGLAAAPSNIADPLGGAAGMAALGLVFGIGATGFAALGQPHLLTWVMAVKDRKSRLQGAGVALSWGVAVYAGMSILGLSARGLYGADAPAEGVFLQAAADFLPAIFAGIVTAATLSAIMSTVDSQILVASAAVSHDLGASRLMPGREVLVTRFVILVLCAAAILLTVLAPASIFDRVLFAWTALGGAFGPVFVSRAMGLKPRASGIVVAMLAGFVLAVFFNQFASLPGLEWARPGSWAERILPLVAGLGICFVTSPRKRAA
jgi:sodium/proline symporter